MYRQTKQSRIVTLHVFELLIMRGELQQCFAREREQ